jgi:hypothetical protein
VHQGWHDAHRYVIQVLTTHASTWVHRYSSLLQWSVPLDKEHIFKAPGGIRNRCPTKRVAADLRRRPCSQRDQPCLSFLQLIKFEEIRHAAAWFEHDAFSERFLVARGHMTALRLWVRVDACEDSNSIQGQIWPIWFRGKGKVNFAWKWVRVSRSVLRFLGGWLYYRELSKLMCEYQLRGCSENKKMNLVKRNWCVKMPSAVCYNIIHCLHIFICYTMLYQLPIGGTRWRSWFRHCDKSWKVAGSIPDGVTGIFHWHNPTGRTMALRLIQPVTEMNIKSFFLGGGGGEGK